MPHLPQVPPPPLPPASAEYQSSLTSASGLASKPQPWKMFRSSQGLTRVDSGNTGVINNPLSKQTILLDHAKQEARVIPALPAAPGAPQLGPGGLPHAGAAPAMPNVTDLGKRMIAGHEAEGKLFHFTPPKAPTIPGMKPPAVSGMQAPAIPQGPAMPGMKAPTMPAAKLPAAPQAPAMPGVKPPVLPAVKPPAIPQVHTAEVWTSTKLHMPLLSKASGSQGVQTTVCKSLQGGEPPASTFQVPPGYKTIMPKPPALPSVPKPPALPKVPKLPGMP